LRMPHICDSTVSGNVYISGNCNIPQNTHLTNFLLVKV